MLVWNAIRGYAWGAGSHVDLHNDLESLALELAEHQMTVNAIAPGAVFTDMNRKALSDEGRRAKLLERIPLRRIGQPEEMVRAAVFLVLAESDYVTGVTIHVDGGFLLL